VTDRDFRADFIDMVITEMGKLQDEHGDYGGGDVKVKVFYNISSKKKICVSIIKGVKTLMDRKP